MMGWKTLREYYAIDHIVHVEDDVVWIGSGYLPQLIYIDTRNRQLKWGDLGPGVNRDIIRYWNDFHADIGKFWNVVLAKDVFEKSLPVFWYRNGEIKEAQCEAYGWPNVTHDGRLMYDNVHFENWSAAVDNGIREATAGIEIAQRAIKHRTQELNEAEDSMQAAMRELAMIQKIKDAANPEANL